MEIGIIILLFFLVVSIYVIFNLLKKLETYEDTLEKYDQFISKKAEVYSTLLEKMRTIDQRQMFEKDDDVGSIFESLKSLIEDYQNFE